MGLCRQRMGAGKIESRYKRKSVTQERTIGKEQRYLTTIQKKCGDLWRKLVKRKGRCELCGYPQHLHAHHPVGRKNPQIAHNPLLGVCLCGFPRPNNCHDKYPQEKLDELLAALLPRIFENEPDRAVLLQTTADTYKRVNHKRTDWNQIYAELQRFERENADGWLQDGCEPVFGRKYN